MDPFDPHSLSLELKFLDYGITALRRGNHRFILEDKKQIAEISVWANPMTIHIYYSSTTDSETQQKIENTISKYLSQTHETRLMFELGILKIENDL